MSKITLNNISTLENSIVGAVNANNATITAAIDNTLSRDGTSPNSMASNLDMNSYRILNLPAPSSDTEPLRKGDLTSLPELVPVSDTTIREFDTKTSAQFSIVTTPLLRVNEEGSQAVYSYDPNTTSGATINTSNGRKYRNIEKVLTPEMFGASSTSSDNTQAFTDLATELRWRGGGRVEFNDNKTYTVWPTITNQSVLMNLSNIKNCRMCFNGSKLVTPYAFSDAVVSYVILADAPQNLVLEDFAFEQTNYHPTDPDPTRGVNGIYVQDDFHGIELKRPYMLGGLSGFICSRGAGWSPAKRGEGVDLTDGYFESVYYPLNAQANGDQIEAVLTTKYAGRSYFIYNVRQHRVVLNSEMSGPFDDILIKVYVNNTEDNDTNTTSDIDVRYFNPGRQFANPNTGACARLAMQQVNATASAGYIRNIKLRMEVENGSTYGTSTLLSTSKHNADGTIDNVGRGHGIENVEISGYATGWNFGIKAIDLFNPANGDFSGDSVINLTFKDLRLDGSDSSVYINSACIDKNLTFDNVFGSLSIDFNGTLPEGILDASKGVALANLASTGQTGTPGSDGFSAYRRLPNGRLECWGINSVANVSSVSVTFPVAFRESPNISLTSATGMDSTATPKATSISGTGFTINNPGTSTGLIYWRCIGKE